MKQSFLLVIIFLIAVQSTHAHDHHTSDTNGNARQGTEVKLSDEVLGQNNWQYKILTNVINLPHKHHVNVQDYHGVAIDNKGRAYIAYYSKKTNEQSRTLVRFNYNPSKTIPFQLDRFLGDESWIDGRVHGLNIISDHDRKEKLVLVYNKNRVRICDLDGQGGWGVSEKVFNKATDGNRSPKSKNLAVYDGYASNLLYGLDLKTGAINNKPKSGRGAGDAKTNTAHGIGVDPEGNYVIADRSNKRLVWRNPDLTPLMIKDVNGKLKQKQLAMPSLEVCNVAFKDQIAVVPCLNASIAIIGPNPEKPGHYKILSKFKMPKKYIDLGYDGIHDANFTNDLKYIVVSTWQRKRNIAPRVFVLERQK